MKNKHKGFTLVELLVVMAIIALLLGLLLPALAKARATARQVKDGTQVKQIHQGLLTAASSAGGIYPLPGTINHVGTVPGRHTGALAANIGPGGDERQNNHANLWGAMIGKGFVNAQILVSPAEVNSHVVPCATYNFNRINPSADVYWDPIDATGGGTGGTVTGFQANLDGICHTSYATMPVDPSIRRGREWRNTGNSQFAIISNRGPRGGTFANTDTIFINSKTLKIHGGDKEWDGNTGYNDNHVEFGNTFYPTNVAELDRAPQSGGPANQAGVSANKFLDNLFKNDGGGWPASSRCSDIFMTIQKTSMNPSAADGKVMITNWDGGDQSSWD